MWFDARAKLAEIAGEPPATLATIATQTPAAPQMSRLSQVSQPPRPQKQAFLVASAEMPLSAQARADGLSPDAGQYLDRLCLHGPATYGATATAMGWGATRAWRAEAELRALGLVRLGLNGQAEPIPKKGNS